MKSFDHSTDSYLEQFFPVMPFIMLSKVVLTFSLWAKSLSVTIEMKLLICSSFL